MDNNVTKDTEGEWSLPSICSLKKALKTAQGNICALYQSVYRPEYYAMVMNLPDHRRYFTPLLEGTDLNGVKEIMAIPGDISHLKVGDDIVNVPQVTKEYKERVTEYYCGAKSPDSGKFVFWIVTIE